MGVLSQLCNSFLRPDERYFRTPNLHLAAVLLSQGFPLVNVDRTDPANCLFIFRRTNDLEELVERFDAKKSIYVDVRKFIDSWKVVRSKINGTRF